MIRVLVLEDIFKKNYWEIIDGKYLHYLRIADHIIIFSNSIEDLQRMLSRLHEASKVDLLMNLTKSKFMNEFDVTITVNNHAIKRVDKYSYLGHTKTWQRESNSRD